MKQAEIYYSPSTKGFYNTDIHADKDIPGDRVSITSEEWIELLDHQSAGREIVMGTNRRPIAIERKASKADVRSQRNAALAKSDWLVLRHRHEAEIGMITTLTDSQYQSLLAWRQQLRSLTADVDFPDITLPKCPV